MPLRVFIMLHTCALDKLSDLHSWPQQQLTKEPPGCRKEPDWSSSVSTQYKSPTTLVLPCSHSLLSVLGQRWAWRSSSGSSQAQPGPAVPAVFSHVTLMLAPGKSPQHSPELWKLIMLHMSEYMFPAAVRNFIQIPKPLKSQRNTLSSPAAFLVWLLPRIVLMLLESCHFLSVIRSFTNKIELAVLYQSHDRDI